MTRTVPFSAFDRPTEGKSGMASTAARSMAPDTGHRLSVAVLVDLIRHPGAGGHVKAWERFADAARNFEDALDLTVYYLGDGITETTLSDHVRLRTVPPAFGTQRLPWLRNGGGDTDLASFNPHLARLLPEHDLFHATSAFAFAKTAKRVAKSLGRPLVSSLHTDAAKFAKVYTGEIIERMVGHGVLSDWLIHGIGIPDISARNLNRARDRILAASDHVLVSDPEDERHVHAESPGTTISYLRRGIDKTLFSPGRRDRIWLKERYGIPADRVTLLFAGRVDQSKRVLTTAETAKRLLDEGQDLHLVVAGEGSETDTIADMLGERATLTGNLDQVDLATLMASADLFVFPSESEIVGNVVIEAKASGLPAIVTGGATTGHLITTPGVDGILTGDRSVEAYVDATRQLLIDPTRRRCIGDNARICIEKTWPDWSDVLAEDLLSVWRSVWKAHR